MLRILPALGFLGLLAACAPTQPVFDQWGRPVHGYSQGPNIGTNTVLGATGGAVAGGLIGRSLGGRDGRGTRTTLGAIAGGLAGGILGNALEPPRQPPMHMQNQMWQQQQYWNGGGHRLGDGFVPNGQRW